MSNIAVLMTVHNRCQKTLACLESLFGQQKGDYELEVYLTDDGCTDDTVPQINQRYPSVKIIHGNGSLFWNRGMLAAWKEAAKTKHDFYLWLNDDTLLVEDAINRLRDCSYGHNNICVIVGSTQDNINNQTITYGGRDKSRKHFLILPDAEKSLPCDTFNGNIVLIPNSVFSKVGFNDNFFHHGFGDIDYGLRVTTNGLQNFIAPGVYGYCKRNNPIPIFRRKGKNLIQRYKLLYSPLGFNPNEDFHLNKKNNNIVMCCLWYVKLHLNVLVTKK